VRNGFSGYLIFGLVSCGFALSRILKCQNGQIGNKQEEQQSKTCQNLM
jgi:hypothetical protein